MLAPINTLLNTSFVLSKDYIGQVQDSQEAKNPDNSVLARLYYK